MSWRGNERESYWGIWRKKSVDGVTAGAQALGWEHACKLVDWPSEHKGEWPGWEQNLQGMAVDNQKRLSVYRTIKPPYLRLSFCG